MESNEKLSEVPIHSIKFTTNPFDSLFEKVVAKVQANPKGKLGIKWYFERDAFLFEFWPFWERVIYEYTQIQCNVLTTSSPRPGSLTTNTFRFADYCEPGYPLEFKAVRPPLGGYWYHLPQSGPPVPAARDDLDFFFTRLADALASFIELFHPF